jgi:hypothetical protein
MRWRLAIAALMALVLAAVIALNRRSEPPVQVTGDLSSRDMSEIRLALRRYLHPPIFGHLSWPDLRAAPGRILQRFTRPYPEVQRIERRTEGFAVILGRRPTQDGHHKYLFYAVFRTTNSWWVNGECELQTLDAR